MAARVAEGRSGDLIVERLSDPSGQADARSACNDDGSSVVEHRAGAPDRHFGAAVADGRAAHAVITAWAQDRPGWRDSVPWQPVTF